VHTYFSGNDSRWQRIWPSDKTNALQRWFDGFLTGDVSCKAETYPYRLIYYDDDRNYNIDNYNECINTYFSGNDSRWQRIWWDVADNE
jgi:hypothetical protein